MTSRRGPRRLLPAAALAAVALLGAGWTSSAPQLVRFERQGIRLDYPRAWFLTTRPLSNGLNPAYRFTVASVPVERTPRDSGPCLPGVAAQVPPTAVLAYLREALGADRVRSLPRMPPRPRRFRLPTPADNALCGFGPGGRWIPFQEAGRVFYLGLYVGPGVSPERVRRLARMLSGMRIEQRSPGA